jgi:arylsulfatase A-like enzyme
VPAGTVSEQVICLSDLTATIARLLAVPLPKGAAEDSFDVSRALTEPKTGAPLRDHVILQAADATYAIRMGDWKLIERSGAPQFESVRNKKKTAQAEKKKKSGSASDELYNLRDDGAEEKNVIAANADRAAQMKKILQDARAHGFTRPPGK